MTQITKPTVAIDPTSPAREMWRRRLGDERLRRAAANLRRRARDQANVAIKPLLEDAADAADGLRDLTINSRLGIVLARGGEATERLPDRLRDELTRLDLDDALQTSDDDAPVCFSQNRLAEAFGRLEERAIAESWTLADFREPLARELDKIDVEVSLTSPQRVTHFMNEGLSYTDAHREAAALRLLDAAPDPDRIRSRKRVAKAKTKDGGDALAKQANTLARRVAQLEGQLAQEQKLRRAAERRLDQLVPDDPDADPTPRAPTLTEIANGIQRETRCDWAVAFRLAAPKAISALQHVGVDANKARTQIERELADKVAALAELEEERKRAKAAGIV
jgi:hypothetical protein